MLGFPSTFDHHCVAINQNLSLGLKKSLHSLVDCLRTRTKGLWIIVGQQKLVPQVQFSWNQDKRLFLLKKSPFFLPKGFECLKELTKSTDLSHHVFSDPSKIASLGWMDMRLAISDLKNVQTLSNIDLLRDSSSDDLTIW
jgi:hypothetical protein